jgi:hypothetical protein
LGGLAMAGTAPADAGVSVGIHLGPHYHHGWCYHHRCGHPYYHHYVGHAAVVRVGPYYWHGRHWWHRRFYHGYWRYY